MKTAYLVIGAAILVPCAGAVAGANIGTEPIGVKEDVTALLPQQQVNSIPVAQRVTHQARLPNHYAMETPEGRVEIEELALRGRYRDHVRYAEPSVDFAYDTVMEEAGTLWKPGTEDAEGGTSTVTREWVDTHNAQYATPSQPAQAAYSSAAHAGKGTSRPAQSDIGHPPEPIGTQVALLNSAAPVSSGQPRIIDVEAELLRQR